MGKRGLQYRTFYEKSRSPCTQRRTKQTSQNLVWVPKIPTWEKEFCYKIGLFTWENFLEAKKLTRLSYKILDWNDSAAAEAFHRSKRRFFAMINGLSNPDESDELSPDLYIDEIHWDDEDDGLEWAGGGNSDVEEDEDDEDEEEEEEVNGNGDEAIKPTGWDCKDEEFSAGKVLIGLIVGY